MLAKFARARNLDVKQAAEMLVATLRWRDEFKIEEVMQEQFDEDVFGRLGKVFGKDKEGRPVTYNLYGAVKDMKAVFGDVQKFIRYEGGFACMYRDENAERTYLEGGACSSWRRASSCSTLRLSIRWCRFTVCSTLSLCEERDF